MALSLVLLLLTLCTFHSVVSASLTQLKTKRATIPDYALKYAPYTHLYGNESWWPSDIATHVQHVTPEENYTAIPGNLTLENLNSSFSAAVYMTSNDNVEDNPAWLLSTNNTPNSAGYSAAPATIIVAPKTDGIVDVFYFYFYSYNHGPKFVDITFGNHVGDWEHTMVRFVNEIPEYIYLSAHDSGSAYNYTALTQTNGRATTYVASGTHANYATAGKQDYIWELLGTLSDITSDGPYWDVTANYRGFYYDNSTATFTSAGGTDIGGTEQTDEGVDWLYWLGRWGDEQYPDSDSRQYCVFDQCHYVTGPTGPLDKNLGRTTVCENDDSCDIKSSL